MVQRVKQNDFETMVRSAYVTPFSLNIHFLANRKIRIDNSFIHKNNYFFLRKRNSDKYVFSYILNYKWKYVNRSHPRIL